MRPQGDAKGVVAIGKHGLHQQGRGAHRGPAEVHRLLVGGQDADQAVDRQLDLHQGDWHVLMIIVADRHGQQLSSSPQMPGPRTGKSRSHERTKEKVGTRREPPSLN